MPIVFELEEAFPFPPERTFRALTDLDSAGEWMPNFVSIERLEGTGFDVGTRFVETRRMFGREASETLEVTAVDPPVHVSIFVDGSLGASKRGEYVFDYYLHPEDSGTRVVLRGVVRGVGKFWELIAPLMVRPLKSACRKDLRALRDFMEREGA